MRIASGTADSEDGGVPQGALLRCYAMAILDRSQDLEAARKPLLEAVGVDAVAQAASVVASFDGINRVADATGIRLDPESEATGAGKIVEALEFEALRAARS